MIWYITLKDIYHFFVTEKIVFIWLIVSMITGSFILNYSYSFARYRGDLYDESMGIATPVYKVSGSEKVILSEFEGVFSNFEAAGFPEVVSLTCLTDTENGIRIAGSTEISPEDFSLTGAWVEGYALPISDDQVDVCAINESLLSYEGRIKMTGEIYTLDEEDFIICGVYESFGGEADILIYIDKYIEKYGYFDDIWITFEEALNENQQQVFETIMKEYIEHGSIRYPELSSDTGEMITASNQMQYSIFIVLLVVFLASIIQYWYDVNISTYTVYWLTGASNKKILGVVFCETLILCASTYVIGLILNVIFRGVFTKTAPLTANDVILGFSIFFGTMLVFSLLNMVRICRTFSVNNIRRD